MPASCMGNEGLLLLHRVKKMMDDFKQSAGWDERHFIGVHIRRTDLAITQPDVSPYDKGSCLPGRHVPKHLKRDMRCT